MINKQVNYQVNFNPNTTALKTSLQSLQKDLQSLAAMPIRLDDGSVTNAINNVKQLEHHLKAATDVNTGKLDISKFAQQLKQSNMDLKTYANSLNMLGTQGQTAFLKLAQSIAAGQGPLRRTNKLMAELWTTMKNTMRWQLTSSLLTGFTSAIGTAVGYAKDLDKSLNDIRIVSGQSAASMDAFAERANKAAKALSASTLAYTDAAKIYYQQGDLGTKAIEERTEATIKMSNVTGDSAEEVSSYMTAIWNNFDKGGKSLEYFADVMAKLGAETAASTSEIATGLEKFAGIAETVGLSYEYATSALATLVAETRQSPETVGTALKTIFSRLQGLSLGETLEDGTTLNKYSEALAVVGVQIKEQDGSLKDMDKILDELGRKWSLLAEDQKMALAQTVGGVRQYTQLITLMENYDDFKINVDLAVDAEGTLDEQQKIFEDGWEASSKRVRASLEQLYSQLIDKDMFTDINNMLSGLLDSVSGVIKGFGGIGNMLLPVFGMLASKLMPQLVQGSMNFVYNLKNSLGFSNALTQSMITQVEKELQKTDVTANNNSNYNAIKNNTLEILRIEQERISLQGSISNEQNEILLKKKEELALENALLEKEGKREQTLNKYFNNREAYNKKKEGKKWVSTSHEERKTMAEANRNLYDAAYFNEQLNQAGVWDGRGLGIKDIPNDQLSKSLPGAADFAKDKQSQFRKIYQQKGYEFDVTSGDAYGLSQEDQKLLGFSHSLDEKNSQLASKEASIQKNLGRNRQEKKQRSKLEGERDALKKEIEQMEKEYDKLSDSEKKRIKELEKQEKELKEVIDKNKELSKAIEEVERITKNDSATDEEKRQALKKLEAQYQETTDAMQKQAEAVKNEAEAQATEAGLDPEKEQSDTINKAKEDAQASPIEGDEKEALDAINQAEEDLHLRRQERTMAYQQMLSGVTSALSGMSMMIQSIQSLGSIWTNDDLSLGEKITSTIMTMSMALGSLGSITQGVAAITTGFNLVKKAGQDIDTFTIALRTAEIAKEKNYSLEKAKSMAMEELDYKKDQKRIKGNIFSGISKELKKGFPAMLPGLAAIGLVAASIGVGIVSAVGTAYNQHLQNEANEDYEEFSKTKQKAEENDTNTKKYKQLFQAHEELQQEQGESLKASDELKKKVEELSDSYDLHSGVIANLTGDYSNFNKELKEAIDNENKLLKGQAKQAQTSLGKSFGDKIEAGAGGEWDWWQRALIGVGGLATAIGGIATANPYLTGAGTVIASQAFTLPEGYNQSSESYLLQNGIISEDLLTGYQDILSYDETTGKINVHFDSSDSEEAARYAAFLQEYSLAAQSSDATKEQIKSDQFYQEAQTKIAKIGDEDITKAVELVNSLNNIELETISNKMFGVLGEKAPKTIKQMERVEESFIAQANAAGVSKQAALEYLKALPETSDLMKTSDAINNMFNGLENEEELKDRAKELYDLYGNIIFDARINLSADPRSLEKLIEYIQNEINNQEFQIKLGIEAVLGETWEKALSSGDKDSMQAILDTLTKEDQFKLLQMSPKEGRQWLEKQAFLNEKTNGEFKTNANIELMSAQTQSEENLNRTKTNLDTSNAAVSKAQENYDSRKKDVENAFWALEIITGAQDATIHNGAYNNEKLKQGIIDLGLNLDDPQLVNADEDTYAKFLHDYAREILGENVIGEYYAPEYNALGLVSDHYSSGKTLKAEGNAVTGVYYSEQGQSLSQYSTVDEFLINEKNALDEAKILNEQRTEEYNQAISTYNDTLLSSKTTISKDQLLTLTADAQAAKSAEQLEIIYKNTAKTIGPYWDKMREFYKDDPLALKALTEYEDEYQNLMNERSELEKEYAKLAVKDQDKLSKSEKERIKELNEYFGTNFPEQLNNIDNKYQEILDKNQQIIKQADYQKKTLSNFDTYESTDNSEYERDMAKAQIIQSTNEFIGSNFITEDNWEELYGWIKAGLEGDEAAWDKLLQKRDEYLKGDFNNDGIKFDGLRKELTALGIEYDQVEQAANNAGIAMDDLYNQDGTVNFTNLAKLITSISKVGDAGVAAAAKLASIALGVPEEIVTTLIIQTKIITTELDTWFKDFKEGNIDITGSTLNDEFKNQINYLLQQPGVSDSEKKVLKNMLGFTSIADAEKYYRREQQSGGLLYDSNDTDKMEEFGKKLQEMFEGLYNFDYTYDPSEGDGGGGGEDTTPEKKVKKYNAELEKTKAILENIGKEYEKLEKLSDSYLATDEDRLVNLIGLNNNLNEQLDLYNDMKTQAEEALPDTKKEMEKWVKEAGFTEADLQYDQEGRIINLPKLIQEMDHKIADAPTGDAQSELEEAKGLMEEGIENFNEIVEALVDAEMGILDTAIEISKNNLEQITLPFEIFSRRTEQERKSVETYLGWLEDVNGKSVDRLNYRSKTSLSLLEEYGANEDKINTLLSTGLTTQAQRDALEEALNHKLELRTSLLEEQKSIIEEVGNYLEEHNEYIDRFYDTFDRINSLLDTYKSVMEVVGKNVEEHQTINLKISDTQIKNSQMQLRAAKATKEAAQATYNAVKKAYDDAVASGDETLISHWEEQLWSAEDRLNEAADNFQSAWTDSLDLILERYELAVEQTILRFEDSLSPQKTLDEKSKLYENLLEESDRFLTNEERVYELNKINRQINQEMSKNPNILVQQKLLGIQELINKLKKDEANITDYQLSKLQKIYDLRLAEIALEEAQNNKTQARLVRNSQGNWNYVFTADQGQIDQAAQQLEDARYNYYNNAKEQADKLSKEILDNEKNLSEALKNIKREDYTSEEEYRKALDDTAKYYLNRDAYLRAQMDEALYDSGQSYEDSVLGQIEGYESLDAAHQNLETATETAINEMVSHFATFEEEVKNTMTEAGEDYDTFVDKLDTSLDSITSWSETASTNVSNACKTMVDSFQTVIDKAIEFAKAVNLEGMTTEEFNEMIKTDSNSAFDKTYSTPSGHANTDYTGLALKLYETYGEEAEKLIKIVNQMRNQKISSGLYDTKDATYMSTEEFLNYVQSNSTAGSNTLGKKIELDLSKEIDNDIQNALNNLIDNSGYFDATKHSQGVSSSASEEENANFVDRSNIVNVTTGEKVTEQQLYDALSSPGLRASFKLNDLQVNFTKGPDGSIYGTSEHFAGIKSLDEIKAMAQFKDAFNPDFADDLASSWSSISIEDPQSKYLEKELIMLLQENKDKYLTLSKQGYVVRVFFKSEDNTVQAVDEQGNPLWWSDVRENLGYSGEGYLEWLEELGINRFDTGGYTGDWNSKDGKLAMLHEKEIVLNKADTKNLLSAVEVLRGMSTGIAGMLLGNAGHQMNGLARAINVATIGAQDRTLQQQVHIDATFPGVTSAFEIETALNNIINDVSQYAEIKKF